MTHEKHRRYLAYDLKQLVGLSEWCMFNVLKYIEKYFSVMSTSAYGVRLFEKGVLTLDRAGTRICCNNTPPASRKISAPRGVTRFWGVKK